MLKSNTKLIKEEEKKNSALEVVLALNMRLPESILFRFHLHCLPSLLGAKQLPYISNKFIYLFGHFP